MNITDETRRESYDAAKPDAAVKIEMTGKKICDRTGRNVALWAVRKGLI